MQKLGTMIALTVALAASSCGSRNPYNDHSDDQLVKDAGTLNLEERYDLYYSVYYSRTPRRPILAPKVAEFKEPALALAIERATRGGKELLAALPIIEAVNVVQGVHCTDRQREELSDLARREGLGETVQQQIVGACGSGDNAGHDVRTS
jgi:hypothetical protein